MKKLEVSLDPIWISEIIDTITQLMDVEKPLESDEKDAMEKIIINSIALYQAKITEHLVQKTNTLN